MVLNDVLKHEMKRILNHESEKVIPILPSVLEHYTRGFENWLFGDALKLKAFDEFSQYDMKSARYIR